MRGVSKQRKLRPCGKKILSESKALGVVKSARRSGNPSRREQRAYRCNSCQGWHTSSQGYEEYYSKFND